MSLPFLSTQQSSLPSQIQICWCIFGRSARKRVSIFPKFILIDVHRSRILCAHLNKLNLYVWPYKNTSYLTNFIAIKTGFSWTPFRIRFLLRHLYATYYMTTIITVWFWCILLTLLHLKPSCRVYISY